MSSRSNKRRLSMLTSGFAAAVALSASLLVGASASAQTQVTGNWQNGTTEPSYITMYEYVPTKLATNPPILVVIHYCGGNASGIWGEASGNGGTSTSIKSAVDAEGILVVLPQLNGRNCWDVSNTGTTTGNSLMHASGTASGGDTKAIVDMVNYEIKTRNANGNRVYAVGSSSGAMMTEALLAVYPEVFKAGAEFAGVPAGCWSDQYAASNQWSGPCAGGTDTMTAAAWGTLAKNMDPGYTGTAGLRPRIQLWHGSADTTISPVNQAQAILQWTNVMGLPTNPDTTTSVTIGGHTYSRQQWKDPSCSSIIQLDAWTESNGPHGTDANMNGQYPLPFMNLDSASTPFAATDPQSACGTSSTGSGGTTGSSGGTTGSSGGTTGSSGGTTGAGGAKGGTTGSSGGNTGAAGASVTGSGGNNTTSGAGGNSSSGSGGNNTTSGAGGNSSSGSGGNNATSGAGGNSSSGSGGNNTTSGAGGNSSSGSGGDTSSGSGGDSSSGSGGDSSSGSGGMAPPPATPAGCACNVGSTPGSLNALALGVFALMFSRRRSKRSTK